MTVTYTDVSNNPRIQRIDIRIREIADKQEAILKAAEATGGELNAEQSAEFDNLTSQREACNVERQAEIDSMTAKMNQKASCTIDLTGDFPREVSPNRTTSNVGRGRSYAEMFGVSHCNDNGWRSFTEFASCIARGMSDQRLYLAQTGQLSGVPSDGGYAVPERFAQVMLDRSLEMEVIRSRARVFPMDSDTLHLPMFDSDDNSERPFGLISKWIDEAEEITPSKAKLKRLRLSAAKLAMLTRASSEVLADAGGFEGVFSDVMTQSMAFELDNAFINGASPGGPEGILQSDSVITIDLEAGQPAGTVLYKNLANMYSRLYPPFMRRSVWLVTQELLPSLLQLSIPIGTAGAFVPALNESNGEFRMLGRPAVFSEKMPPAGERGAVVLADLSNYAIGLRRDMSLDRSTHVWFTSDEIAFRLLLRATGRSLWSKPYTPRNGASQSWCVALAGE